MRLYPYPTAAIWSEGPENHVPFEPPRLAFGEHWDFERACLELNSTLWLPSYPSKWCRAHITALWCWWGKPSATCRKGEP